MERKASGRSTYKMKGFNGFGNSPAKKNGDKKGKIIGENTSKIETDDKGMYSLIREDTDFASKGDTVRFTPNTPIVDDEYISGGDYKASKKGKTIKIDKED